MDKIKLLLMTSRPISWVNTAYPFAAGYLLLGGELGWYFWVATIFFLIPYNLLMYGVNDVYDYESDMRNPRKGGIEGAVTPKKYHRLILQASVWGCLPFIIGLLVGGNLNSGLILMAVIFFVVAYSLKGLRFKEVPILDSITSSMHFVGPLLFAYGLLGSVPAEGWLAAVAFFAWGMASQAFGAVQDVNPDREAGLRSIATVLGSRTTVWLALGLYLLASLLVIMIGSSVATIIGLASLAYSFNISMYLMTDDANSGQARAGWRRFIWLNYIVGAIVTISLIYSSLV